MKNANEHWLRSEVARILRNRALEVLNFKNPLSDFVGQVSIEGDAQDGVSLPLDEAWSDYLDGCAEGCDISLSVITEICCIADETIEEM